MHRAVLVMLLRRAKSASSVSRLPVHSILVYESVSSLALVEDANCVLPHASFNEVQRDLEEILLDAIGLISLSASSGVQNRSLEMLGSALQKFPCPVLPLLTFEKVWKPYLMWKRSEWPQFRWYDVKSRLLASGPPAWVQVNRKKQDVVSCLNFPLICSSFNADWDREKSSLRRLMKSHVWAAHGSRPHLDLYRCLEDCADQSDGVEVFEGAGSVIAWTSIAQRLVLQGAAVTGWILPQPNSECDLSAILVITASIPETSPSFRCIVLDSQPSPCTLQTQLFPSLSWCVMVTEPAANLVRSFGHFFALRVRCPAHLQPSQALLSIRPLRWGPTRCFLTQFSSWAESSHAEACVQNLPGEYMGSATPALVCLLSDEHWMSQVVHSVASRRVSTATTDDILREATRKLLADHHPIFMGLLERYIPSDDVSKASLLFNLRSAVASTLERRSLISIGGEVARPSLTSVASFASLRDVDRLTRHLNNLWFHEWMTCCELEHLRRRILKPYDLAEGGTVEIQDHVVNGEGMHVSMKIVVVDSRDVAGRVLTDLENIIQSGDGEHHVLVGIDTEFESELMFEESPSLIQCSVATMSNMGVVVTNPIPTMVVDCLALNKDDVRRFLSGIFLLGCRRKFVLMHGGWNDVLLLRRTYGAPLVEMLTHSQSVLVDTALSEQQVLASVLNTPHGSNNDNPILQFITSTKSKKLSSSNVGLGTLMERYLNYTSQKRFEADRFVNWNLQERPLQPQRLEYPAKDAAVLPLIFSRQCKRIASFRAESVCAVATSLANFTAIKYESLTASVQSTPSHLANNVVERCIGDSVSVVLGTADSLKTIDIFLRWRRMEAQQLGFATHVICPLGLFVEALAEEIRRNPALSFSHAVLFAAMSVVKCGGWSGGSWLTTQCLAEIEQRLRSAMGMIL